MQIKVASVDSVILYFGETISKEVSLKVKTAYRLLKDSSPDGLIEIIPSYTSILISYDVFKFDFNSIKKSLEKCLNDLTIIAENDSKIITIDVYYGSEVGLDLQRVASMTHNTIDEVIQIHSSKIYDVYAIGFLPGFAYLASVDESIVTPRLETPRKSIPKGSVAIADNQTAVYPQNSPGGWNILGRTTFELFDKSLESLSLISIESKIKFNSITKEQYLAQGGSI